MIKISLQRQSTPSPPYRSHPTKVPTEGRFTSHHLGPQAHTQGEILSTKCDSYPVTISHHIHLRLVLAQRCQVRLNLIFPLLSSGPASPERGVYARVDLLYTHVSKPQCFHTNNPVSDLTDMKFIVSPSDSICKKVVCDYLSNLGPRHTCCISTGKMRHPKTLSMPITC